MSLQELIRTRQADLASTSVEIDTEKTRLLTAVRDQLVQDHRFSDFTSSHKDEAIRKYVWQVIEELSNAEFRHLMLTAGDKAVLLENLIQMLYGLGVIEPLVRDPLITEIMVNGADEIFIEKAGGVALALDENGDPLRFRSEKELRHVIEKIVAPINRKVDQSNPIVDARLPNGSRVNVVLPPVSLIGPVLTIRKFPESPFTMDDLVGFSALDHQTANLLQTLVQAKYNIIVAGGTGSGKTTFLNALSAYVGSKERVVTVEDAAELKIQQVENLVRLETRPANVEGKGEIPIRELIKTALRMRPDRIIVGEVRSGEALDMLQAMNTGHDGSLTTGHANSCYDMLYRLETMVLMSGIDLPVDAIRRQVHSAIDLIVYLRRMRDGSRRVVEVAEVETYDQGEIHLNPLLVFQEKGYEGGRIIGNLVSTGKDLIHTNKLAHAGLSIKNLKSTITGGRK